MIVAKIILAVLGVALFLALTKIVWMVLDGIENFARDFHKSWRK